MVIMQIILIGDINLTIDAIKGIEHYGAVGRYDVSGRHYVNYSDDSIFYDVKENPAQFLMYNYGIADRRIIPFTTPQFVIMSFDSEERMKSVLAQDNFFKGIYIDNNFDLLVPIEEFIRIGMPLGFAKHVQPERTALYAEEIEPEKADEIMALYRAVFLEPSFDPWSPREGFSRLYWCHFNVETIVIDADVTMYMDDIVRIKVPHNKTIYCYDERKQKVFLTTFEEFFEFVIHVKPWDDVDIEVFDENMDWTVAVTHERQIICFGVEVA